LLELVDAQARPLIGVLPRWGAFVVPTAFLSALLALAIHSQHVLRARTDPTLAEPWLIEATGPVLLGHRILETLDLLAGACLLAVIFLGGWHFPIVQLPFEITTVLKIAIATVLVIIARNMIPALTAAIALRVCWIVLLPFAALGVVLAFLGVP
jgi:NADH:ubiquinone oxidoreductase subunit H